MSEQNKKKTGSETAVVVEYLEHLVKGVAEGTALVSERLAEMRSEIKQRFDGIDGNLIQLTVRVSNVETKVGSLETKVGSLETKVGSLETKVDSLETNVGSLTTNVGSLTTKVDSLTTKVDSLETMAGDAQQRLKRIEGHLQLKTERGSRTPPRATRTSLSKRYKKS